AHRALTVRRLASRAGILARCPHRMRPLLRKARVVDHPHGLRLQLPDHPSSQTLPYRFPVPGTLPHELLHRLLVAVRQSLGHGFNRLPLAVQQQAAHVHRAPVPAFTAATGSKRSTRNCSRRRRHRSNWASVMPKHNPYRMLLSILNEVITSVLSRKFACKSVRSFSELMVLGYPLLQRNIAEHFGLLLIVSTHKTIIA